MKFNKKLFLFIMVTLLVVFALSGCGIIPKPPEGKISGRVLIPPSEISKDITGWVPTANALVTIVDADGVTHTVTTDENGYYSFEDIAVNPNTIITASVELNGGTLVLKDVIPQAVAANEQYDAGDMDSESTALALLLEAVITSGIDPSDIDINEIKSSDSFLALISQVTSVLEEGGDVTKDPDIADMIEDIINPPVPPSPPSPSPATKLPVYNQTKKTYHTTIQKAINNSSIDDIIVVSTGTYNENIVIDNKNITLRSSDPADPAVVAATIIDGQDLDSVVKILNGDTSTLEGFTIQNGNEYVYYGGGGIFVSGSSPVIRYNVIGDNIEDEVDTGNTGDCGGGICVVEYSETPHIYENTIIGNSADYGGGMYVGYGSPLVEKNTIKENTSKYDGGGITVFNSKKEEYCPTIRDNTIEYNVADNGGGIAVDDLGDAIIENNGINNNEAISGGGIYVYYQADADIRGNNIIENNEAEHDGGGIYIFSEGIISITANTINNNTANIDSSSYSGGGIYVADGSPTIGGSTDTDTDNFNTICYNSPDQVDPDNYPNNDYCYFTFDETTKTITGYNIAGGVDVVIPTTIGGIPVEHIGDQAFQNKGLTSVTIPDSVTTVGRYAFSYNQLAEVNIPDSVTTIGYGAFAENQLTSLILGNSVTTIGGHAFYNNQLTSVNIPDSVTSIGGVHYDDGYVFANNLLTSLTLGNSVTIVGYAAFENNKLAEVTIPDGVTISNDAFKDNTLTSVTIGISVYIIDSDSTTMGTNGGFLTAYSSEGNGTYNYTGSAWVKQSS